jgi:hypothetical protein
MVRWTRRASEFGRAVSAGEASLLAANRLLMRLLRAHT